LGYRIEEKIWTPIPPKRERIGGKKGNNKLAQVVEFKMLTKHP
jgi:hypothetical protein